MWVVGTAPLGPMADPDSPGSMRMRVPGEPIPEAFSWPNRGAWVRTGKIRWQANLSTDLRELLELAPTSKLLDWLKARHVEVPHGANREQLLAATVQALEQSMTPQPS